MPRGDATGPPSGPGTGHGAACAYPSCGTIAPYQAGVPCHQIVSSKCGAKRLENKSVNWYS